MATDFTGNPYRQSIVDIGAIVLPVSPDNVNQSEVDPVELTRGLVSADRNVAQQFTRELVLREFTVTATLSEDDIATLRTQKRQIDEVLAGTQSRAGAFEDYEAFGGDFVLAGETIKVILTKVVPQVANVIYGIATAETEITLRELLYEGFAGV